MSLALTRKHAGDLGLPQRPFAIDDGPQLLKDGKTPLDLGFVTLQPQLVTPQDDVDSHGITDLSQMLILCAE